MPADLTHRTYDVNGIQMHVAEQGEGPAVILCHGFPEIWYSWRHQLPAVADAGFRAMAPDMRGYGRTTAPPDLEDYRQEVICADLVALLDRLRLPDAVFVGHDWGGVLVWNMALHHPQRVRAVAGINTPLFPPMPASFLETMRENPGTWDYQFYFQEPGIAETELEQDVGRTCRLILRSSDPADGFDVLAGFHNVRAQGGVLIGYPQDAPRSVMLSEDDLQCYVEQFQRTGFRGGLNWYRNHDANWAWDQSVKEYAVPHPALMVTAGRDPVLSPKLARKMEQWVPNLTRGHIERCGHWTQQEAPDELNRILIEWLGRLPAR